jgi:hypothetical protein
VKVGIETGKCWWETVATTGTSIIFWEIVQISVSGVSCFWYAHSGLLLGLVSMPIRPLLNGSGVFSPDEISVITSAFEDALSVLGLVDRQDPAATILAKRMMELARGGERDPMLLRDAVLKSLRDDPGTSGL